MLFLDNRYGLLFSLWLCGSCGFQTEGCKQGFYGTNCDKACPWPCRNNVCSRNGLCAECKSGYYGIRCDHACPTTCIQDECVRYNVTCTQGCKVGWYGKKCQHRCLNCSGNCHRDTGKCLFALVSFSDSQCGLDSMQEDKCVDGCRGDNCDIPCPQNCLQCDRHGGYCTKCEDGKYGKLCIDLCPGSCYPDDTVGKEPVPTSQPRILGQNTDGQNFVIIITVCVVCGIVIGLAVMIVAIVIYRNKSKLRAQKGEHQSYRHNAEENNVLI